LINQNNISEEIDRIIDKIGHYGQQMETIKSKVADLFDQN
jgi:hypothetical protein